MKKPELNKKNTQLNKLKSVAKYKTGTTLRISKKNFQDGELRHELLATISLHI